MNGDSSLTYLLEQVRNGTATAEDYRKLRELVSADNTGAIVEEINDFYKVNLEAAADDSYDRAYWSQALREVLEVDKDREALERSEHITTEEAPIIPIHRRNPWTKWVAAAIIAALIIVGYFMFFEVYNVKPVTPELVKSTDVKAPANNRASIMLASGEIIYLDSASNGTLAKQGNVNIKKIGDGKISYNNIPIDSPHSDEGMRYNTLSNPRGSKVIDITLADGTRVWLNADSRLTYPTIFNGRERSVEIRGEAYFEVAHDAKKPFRVNKENLEVEVLGTHFNVNTYEDEGSIKVTLLEGSVKVSQLTTHISQQIKPGQQAILTDNTHLATDNTVDIEQVMAWKNGTFDFGVATDIKTIMKQIARWYDVDIEYQANKPVKIGGAISRQSNVSAVLEMLEKTGSLKFRIEGKKVIVL